ncbi:hypothetical protein HDU88_007887 [Geranomyces variabilis]|nr:hypothetical protein HDU88_007887 [Geranomyces variabilis]
MIENALLLNEILRAVLVDSGLHWFEVWRLRAVCRAFHRLSKAVLPEVMIKNCAAYPASKVFACAHDLKNAAPPLLHVHSTSEFDDDNVYLKPVKWDTEAETLLFLPAAIDVGSHDPTCSKCLAVKKPSNQHISERLFQDQPGSEQQHEATIVGRCHGDLGSSGRIRFEGWNTVRFTQWDPIEHDPTGNLRHALIKAKDVQGGTLDARKPCVYRDSDEYSHPAIRMVYSVVELDEYLTTGPIAEILEDESLSDSDAEEEAYDYFEKNYLRPKGLKFVDDQIASIGLPRVSRKRAEQRSLYLLSGVPGGSSQLETLFGLPRARAALLSCTEKPGPLLRTSKYMWKVGMSVGLVDWVHARLKNTGFVTKAIKWVKWELSSEKTYSYENEMASETYIVLLAHFILTPGAIAELVRREIAARKAGRADQYRDAISWEFFRFCLELKLDDMSTLLGLGIQAISAYCWNSEQWRASVVWNILMKSGTAHVKALLTDSRNEFKPDVWRVSLNNLGFVAIRQRLGSSDAETSWRVLVDLDLLDWDGHGEQFLTSAIRHQVDVCIEDLLDKGIVSHKALSEFFVVPNFQGEYQQRNNPDMALFKRLVDNPLFYTDRAWAAAVTVLVRPPLESGREALELLVHRPVLTAPTPELIMSLASFGERHPANSANAMLPQIIQLVGKEKVRNLALEFWEHEKTAKSAESQRLCFKRLIEGTIFLHKSFGVNAFEKARFLAMAAYYYNVVKPRGSVRSTEEVDWIERGAFHDIDEHGHSDFAEILLSGMGPIESA